MKRVVFALLASAVAASSHADDRYLGVQAVMGRVEQVSDQPIWLSLPLSDSGCSATVSGQSSIYRADLNALLIMTERLFTKCVLGAEPSTGYQSSHD